MILTKTMIQDVILAEIADQDVTAQVERNMDIVGRIIPLKTSTWRNMHAQAIIIQEDGKRFDKKLQTIFIKLTYSAAICWVFLNIKI